MDTNSTNGNLSLLHHNSKYEERIRSSAGGGLVLSKSQSIVPMNNNTTVPGSKDGKLSKRAQTAALVARVVR